jgi:hypothetical protein
MRGFALKLGPLGAAGLAARGAMLPGLSLGGIFGVNFIQQAGDQFPTCEEYWAAADLCVSTQRVLTPSLSWDLAVHFADAQAAGGIPPNWFSGGPFVDFWDFSDHLICAPWVYAGIEVVPMVWPYEQDDQALWSTSGTVGVCDQADYFANGQFNLFACDAAFQAATGLPGRCTLWCADPSGANNLEPASGLPRAFSGVVDPPPSATYLGPFPGDFTPTWCDCWRWDQAWWGGAYVPAPGPRAPSWWALGPPWAPSPLPSATPERGTHLKGGIRWHRRPFDVGSPSASFYSWFQQLVERYDGDGIDDAFDEIGSVCFNATSPGSGPPFSPGTPCAGSSPHTFNGDCVGRPLGGEPMPPVLAWEIGNEVESNADARWYGSGNPEIGAQPYYLAQSVWPGWGSSMAGEFGELIANARGAMIAACPTCVLASGGMVQPPDQQPSPPLVAAPNGASWSPVFAPWGGIDTTGTPSGMWWWQDNFWTDLFLGSSAAGAPLGSQIDVFTIHDVRAGISVPAYNTLNVGPGSWGALANTAINDLGARRWFDDLRLSPAWPGGPSAISQIWADEVTVPRVSGAGPFQPGDQINELAQQIGFYLAHSNPYGAPRLFAYNPLIDSVTPMLTLSGLMSSPSTVEPAGEAFRFLASLLDDDPIPTIHAPGIGGLPNPSPDCHYGPSGELWGQLDSSAAFPVLDLVPNVVAAEYEFQTNSGRVVWIYWNELSNPASVLCDTEGPAALNWLAGVHYYDPTGSLVTIASFPPDPTNKFPAPHVWIACDDSAPGSAVCP